MRMGNEKRLNVKKSLIYIGSVAILVAVLTVFGKAIPQKLDDDECYVYPMNSLHSDWKNLTIEEKIEACRIPKRVLKNMSDEQLIQAILDYPFVHDIYMCATGTEDGVIEFKKISDAYAELIQRKTGEESLKTFQIEMYSNWSETMSAEEEFQYDVINDLILYFGK